jgi:hypothetical protein
MEQFERYCRLYRVIRSNPANLYILVRGHTYRMNGDLNAARRFRPASS